LLLLLAAAVPSAAAMAQPAQLSPVIPAVAEPNAIPLYGKATPGKKSAEIWFEWFEGQTVSVRNVTYPTITPVLPDPARATGAAVIVAPGGAFEFLSMQHEGWEVARTLADRGVAAFVLKYRLKPTPADQREWMTDLMRRLTDMISANTATRRSTPTDVGKPEPNPMLQFPEATADALAALSLVRANAARWNVDPKHVGMIGFSAGAAATLDAVLTTKPGEGPDFFALIYGPLVKVEVPPQAPPLFAAMAIDDPLFTEYSLIDAWHQAGRPVELHLYQSGGHGFGLGRPNTTNALMMDEFMVWLSMQGFTKSGQRDSGNAGGK